MLLLKNVPNNENNILIPIPKMHKRTDNFIVERLIHNGEDTQAVGQYIKMSHFLKCAFIQGFSLQVEEVQERCKISA